MDVLAWIESTSVAVWVRESVSLWAYPGILSFHTFGLAFVVGTSTAISLRVLGVASAVPLPAMRGFLPVFWVALCLNTLSGGLLLAAFATTTSVNPIFVTKMILVVLAVVITARLGRAMKTAKGEADAGQKRLALACIGLWTVAMIAGRMTAYLDLVKGLLGVE
ncbi:MAG: hypothetical protein AAGK22_28450 [Acidobacteriota bacterium]